MTAPKADVVDPDASRTAEIKAALQEARREKARASREGAPTDEIKARISALQTELDAATTDEILAGARERSSGTAVALQGDEVIGVVAVRLDPGITKEARASAIADALTPHLVRIAEGASVVVAADAQKFTRERPGRDAEGRTVLDVRGRIEGDRVVPDLGALKSR